MAYRYGDREQLGLFPSSIDDYVAKDDPVRAYDAFVEALDFHALGIELDEGQVGPPEYDPKAMMKLLIYGYSYGVRSSRKLEREVHHNLSFMWLVGGLKPDHKTIAEFRRTHKKALRAVLTQSARMCLRLGLIEGTTLFLDGTKIRGNASIKNTWTAERCEREMRRIEERVAAIVAESERLDAEEEGQGSLVAMAKELEKEEVLRAKVKEILGGLAKGGSLNTTDPECGKFSSMQGSHAGYNGQVVVDEKHGLIVSADAVKDGNDLEQFAVQVKKAEETLGRRPETACADAGYASTEELEKIDREGVKVIVPSQRQAAHEEKGPFDKSRFRYDREKDVYICPEGQELVPRVDKGHKISYRMRSRKTCHRCRHYGICTTGKRGREVNRLKNEDVKERLEEQYRESASQEIYRKRKEKAELPFGHIKRNLGVQAFLLRGRDGAGAELGLLTSCFNIRRMMSLLGTVGLIRVLGEAR
jgi:transposase